MEWQGLHEELEEPRPEIGAEAPSVVGGGGCGCEEVEDGDDLVEHLHGVPREQGGHVAVATAVVRRGGVPGFQIQ